MKKVLCSLSDISFSRALLAVPVRVSSWVLFQAAMLSCSPVALGKRFSCSSRLAKP